MGEQQNRWPRTATHVAFWAVWKVLARTTQVERMVPARVASGGSDASEQGAADSQLRRRMVSEI